jgi:hypothetical protein
MYIVQYTVPDAKHKHLPPPTTPVSTVLYVPDTKIVFKKRAAGLDSSGGWDQHEPGVVEAVGVPVPPSHHPPHHRAEEPPGADGHAGGESSSPHSAPAPEG